MALPDTERGNHGRWRDLSWLPITVLLGLPLITPLLRWSSVACTHDGHLHYHRVAALVHAWENGLYLTRWLPDLAFGYGYPFFVYREAAPLYAVLLPHLAGLPLPAASNLFYALTILAAGVFMALWVRDLFGPRAAVVSAVAYMAAPYVLIDALVRGNAPESLALPLFPLLLWAGRRWVLGRSVVAFLVGVLGLALLSISHNISTFLFAPALLVYLVAVAWVRSSSDRRGAGEQGSKGENSLTLATLLSRPPALLRATLLIALGLALAFFYTGGALLEMDQVTLEMSTTTRNNDWRFNFASLGEILAPVAAEDPSLANPPLRFRLGWVPLGLAALGVSGLWWIRGRDAVVRERRLHVWLMLAGAGVFLFMALPLSRAVWEALPLIDFVQFPWRFVGRAALPVAFLAGIPFAHPFFSSPPLPRSPAPLRSILFLLAPTLLIVEALPTLYPRYCWEEPFPTILTVHTYERLSGLVGVDPEGSYFPRTVAERPAGSPLEADYAAGRVPQRFDATALPDGATISDVVYDRFGVTLTVDTPEAFTARYLSFAFAGWSARVDGERVPITPEDPSGLITFDVPTGRHEIVVAWGATPLRLALVGLSGLAGVGVVVVALWGRRPGKRRKEEESADFADYADFSERWAGSAVSVNTSPLTRAEVAALVLLAVALLGGKALVDRVETPLRRVGAPPVAQVTALQGAELRLDGFNLGRGRVPAGETFDIDLAWTALAPPVADYQSNVWLVDANGLMWSDKGTQRPRLYEDAPPSREWSPGQWGWDSHEVRVLDGAPPGRYDIVLTLFDKATLAPVTLTDSGTGEVVGPTAVIGQIEVVNPARPPDFTPQYPLDETLAPGLRLLGYNQDRAEAIPGESVLLTFFWECAEAASCGRVALRLEDAAGATARVWDLPLVREGLAADEWPAHGRLRGQHLLQLPAGLASGRYRFVLQELPLGEIAITAPERTFTPPPLALTLDAPFTANDGTLIATLVGLAAGSPLPPCSPTPPLPCSLPLLWRAESETPVGYHVFVHLVDETGAIVAQSDAVPGEWTRPTTGWLPGEYVLDVHTLALPETLPAGLLTLRIGLYDPDSGERLMAAGGETFATIEGVRE
ncbi:hypothetical protein [Promineifilum sp.]|uniref:hypothetical protein n=1 Tax=Promineifilum sp. TaxID=2664178 RepID=UPI0035B2021D